MLQKVGTAIAAIRRVQGHIGGFLAEIAQEVITSRHTDTGQQARLMTGGASWHDNVVRLCALFSLAQA